MTGTGIGDRALAYAAHGWPVFPCQPGSKEPATRHGYLDACTDPDRITWWWRRHPDANLAIATGTPGPDVLDVDQHGPAGNGFAALNRLTRAGLTRGASAIVATPHRGIHLYYAGSSQRSGKLSSRHLDFKAAGGYILAPPSQVDGKPYRLLRRQPETAGLDWAAVTGLLEPGRQISGRLAGMGDRDLRRLAAWVAGLREGNRNDGLFWAACRAAEAGDTKVLAGLAAAARTAGLAERDHRHPRLRPAHRRTPGRRAAGTGVHAMTPRPSSRLAAVTAATRVDANGTRWRLRSLVAMGHDCARIARALGTRPNQVRRVVGGQAATVTVGFRANAVGLWDAWWDKTPPASTTPQRRAAARALRTAAERGWPAAAGLDEDDLDLPGYRPWCAWRPATGTGTAPDITPAPPQRPCRARDIA